MSTYDKMLKGGSRGMAAVPGKSAESNLFLCSRQKKPMMPPMTRNTNLEGSVAHQGVDRRAPPTMRAKEKIVVNLPPGVMAGGRSRYRDGKLAASRGNQVHSSIEDHPADKKGGLDKRVGVREVAVRSATQDV